MGRRSINTTKSGKFMNPTDQARKEARKRELKRNKKQRTIVRTAVLKGKDPQQILEEMEMVDKMEFDPTQPPRLNERVLKDKHKKLKEMYDRVIAMYEKEDPDYAQELRRLEGAYERKRQQLQVYFEQVKNAERVKLEQIPLPDAPSIQAIASMIPLPGDIPLPMSFLQRPAHGILKKPAALSLENRARLGLGRISAGLPQLRRKPIGPPPGPPAELSDSEPEAGGSEGEEGGESEEEYSPEDNIADLVKHDDNIDSEAEDKDQEVRPPPAKQRRIRFIDDGSRPPNEDEKDTRVKYKAPPGIAGPIHPPKNPLVAPLQQSGVSPLQARMLAMAGQAAPPGEGVGVAGGRGAIKTEPGGESDEEGAGKKGDKGGDGDDEISSDSSSDSSDDDTDVIEKLSKKERASKLRAATAEAAAAAPLSMPTGPPPGLPPGPPPGLPPMMFRGLLPPQGMGGPPRMLPPGPPRGRPPMLMGGPLGAGGMGPPPLMRLPPGPPGMPPPHLLHASHGMPSHPGLLHPAGPPGGMMPPSRLPPPHLNPNVLSAPPSLMQRGGAVGGFGMEGGDEAGGQKKGGATIEAKAQIKHVIGDATRFMPTTLRIKRETRDAKGHIVKQPPKHEDPLSVKARQAGAAVAAASVVTAPTKDDAYDSFMREMEELL